MIYTLQYAKHTRSTALYLSSMYLLGAKFLSLLAPTVILKRHHTLDSLHQAFNQPYFELSDGLRGQVTSLEVEHNYFSRKRPQSPHLLPHNQP